MNDHRIPEDRLTHITCHRARGPIEVDGNLEKGAWKDVPRSPRFVDIVSGDAMRRGSRFDRPELDLYGGNVDVLGGFQDPGRWDFHPRGRRFAFMDFDLEGLETAVRVDGTINDPRTIDRGWTVEMALPWKSLAFLFDGRTLPPGEGETLRCDFSRFQAMRVHGKPIPENPGWSLNPHGVYDSHVPESFSVVHFTDRTAG